MKKIIEGLFIDENIDPIAVVIEEIEIQNQVTFIASVFLKSRETPISFQSKSEEEIYEAVNKIMDIKNLSEDKK
jgi:hypothetical protein